MFQKILVGLDASDDSKRALRVAANLAKIFRAELHVFHAIAHHLDTSLIQIPLLVPIALISPAGYGVDSAALQASYEQAGKDIIADAQEYIEQLQLGLGSQCSYHLEINASPEKFAVDFVKKNNIDLIVLGCKGHHSRVRQALLGTVATKILNDASCQVLIVR
jgi:nucleotide-binding universal stress UspA family protein